MPELIDREVTLQLLDESIKLVDGSSLRVDEKSLRDWMTKNGLLIARRIVSKQPTIQPEQRNGRWIPTEYDAYADGAPVWDKWECSECGHEHKGEEDTLTPFCPNCGARMDGGADNVSNV